MFLYCTLYLVLRETHLLSPIFLPFFWAKTLFWVPEHGRGGGPPGRGAAGAVGHVSILQLQDGRIPCKPTASSTATASSPAPSTSSSGTSPSSIVRKPMDKQKNTVTAQGRTKTHEPTGIVIQNCKIVPEKKLEATRMIIPTDLGRPWKEFSMTVGDFIQPDGWMPWSGTFALDTLFYREYINRGPGSAIDKRVKWKGYNIITSRDEAQKYTAAPFLQGDQWLPPTTIPFSVGLAY